MKNKMLYTIISAAIFSVSTSTAWADDSKVDCSTASDDIAELQSEKKKAAKHKSKGLFSITPIGMVVGAVSGGDKKSDGDTMHVDEYNQKLDDHIAKIKRVCGDNP